MRQELTADQAGSRPAAKPLSDYHRRKQRESARRKLAGQIKRSEEQQAAHRKEQEALEAELLAHPAVWTPELTGRLSTLTRLLHEEERRWIELTEQLESLGA